VTEELRLPTGYVYHAESIEFVRNAVAAPVTTIAGKAKQAIADGVKYVNLKSHVAAFLKRTPNAVTSKRRKIDCGPDGVVLEPLAQQTGICNGCGNGEAAYTSWCVRWNMTRTGVQPRECSFLWAYLLGRQLNILRPGDTGAFPSYTAKGFHDLGVLPVDCGGQIDLSQLPPHGPGSQEALCIQMRDAPRLLDDWKRAASPFRCPVYSPRDAWDLADCLTSGRAVNTGCGFQASESSPGTDGISSLYSLGGHDTFFEGCSSCAGSWR
jgi:hypothetical protein